jgi:hypothetical protein
MLRYVSRLAFSILILGKPPQRSPKMTICSVYRPKGYSP